MEKGTSQFCWSAGRCGAMRRGVPAGMLPRPGHAAAKAAPMGRQPRPRHGPMGKQPRPRHAAKAKAAPMGRQPRPRHAWTDPERRQPPGSFDLLGFTHYWARSRNGNWVVKRKTSTSRFRRGLQALSRWCQINRHQPLATQHQTLSQKLRGHFAYYGITGNSSGLGRFRSAAKGIWRHWLSRRKRGSRMPWVRFYRVLERYPLPPAIAIHSVCRP